MWLSWSVRVGGGEEKNRQARGGEDCFTLFDQTRSAQPHHSAATNTPLYPIILLKNTGTELEPCWISLSNLTGAHKVS